MTVEGGGAHGEVGGAHGKVGGARRAVAAGTVTLLSARFAVAALAMIFIAISTRILTLREMAVFGVYNILCGVQAIVCSVGLLTTCTRELPALTGRGDSVGAARLLRTTMLTNAAISAFVAAVLAAAAGPISLLFLKDEAYAPQLRWVAGAVFLWNLFEANQIFLVALQNFRAYGRANVICALAQRGASLTLWALLHRSGHGLTGYLIGYGAGTLAGLAVQAMPLRKLMALPGGFAPLPPLARYSLPFYADGYFRWLYMQADQFLVGVFLQPEIFSLYFVAKRFVQYYQQIVSSSIDPVLAKVAEIRARGPEAIGRSLRSASRYFTLVFLPFSAGTAALSSFFLRLAGGDPYRPAATVLALLSLSIAFYAVFNLVTGYVYVLGAPADRLRHNLVAGISQIVFMIALFQAVGSASASPLAGAASIAAARIGSLLVGLLFAHGQLRRYIEPTYDLSAVPRAALASAVMAAAILLPQTWFDHPAVVPIYSLAGAALFVVILRPAVRGEDIDLLADLLRGRAKPLERLTRRVFGQPGAATSPGR